MSKSRNIADLGSNDVIETSATGVDVTGTVSADGLTVDTGGTAVVLNHSATGPTLRFNNLDQTVADGQQLARIEFSTDDGGLTTDEAYLQLTATGGGGAGDFDIMVGDGTPVKRARFGVGGDVSFYEDTGTTAKMVWDASAESLGIGTASPQDELHIEANYPQIRVASDLNIIGSNNLTATVDGYGTDGIAWRVGRAFGSGDFQIVNHRSTPVTFDIGGTERARIDSSGNLLVGTTSTTAKFEVYDASNKTEGFPHVRITRAGYSGYHFLDGTAYYIGQNSGARNLRLYSGAETSGVNLSPSGTSWGSFSDERLKENIEPIENALDTISNLRTVKYHLKDVDSNDDKKKIGVIAQDLVGVLDEVIDTVRRTDDDTDYMSVRYTEIIPVLIKGIQEQQETISELKTRIETLENN